MGKDNELSKIKEIHLSATETMRRGHKRAVEGLKRRHNNKIRALKEAHSHTRVLSELSQWVETLLQNVRHLQARVGKSHEWQRQEKEHCLLAGQRLEEEKSETSKEQQQLQKRQMNVDKE